MYNDQEVGDDLGGRMYAVMRSEGPGTWERTMHLRPKTMFPISQPTVRKKKKSVTDPGKSQFLYTFIT